eukprot:gene21011-23063_t
MANGRALQSAVEKEAVGPGKLLGIRAMQNTIRQKHNLNVPRDTVHAMMYFVDPAGLEDRNPAVKKHKRVKGSFTTKGPNWVFSLDGHAKLMGYQKSTFPLAIYGCIDTASHKIIFLNIWMSNSDPKLSHGDMDPVDTVMYGPSTSNQIERWWKELHERLETYFKDQLRNLKEEGCYDPNCDLDRSMLAFIYIPVIQKELDHFKNVIWNTHQIRAQKDVVLPNGIPDHIYSFPEEYDLTDCKKIVTEDQLEEVALHSNIFHANDDYLERNLRDQFEAVVPDPQTILPQIVCKCI